MHFNGNELEQVARRCTAQAARQRQGKKTLEPKLTDQRIGLGAESVGCSWTCSTLCNAASLRGAME